MNKLSWALALLIAILSAATNSLGKDADTTILTKEYLTRNDWGPDIGELGVFFKFTVANTFTTDANFEGGEFYSGTYEMSNNTLVLKIIKSTELRELVGKTLKYKLTKDNNAIYFNEYLALEHDDSTKNFYLKKIWNQNSIVKNSQQRFFQNIKAVTINNLAAIKVNTMYYQFPRENSKRFMFSIFDDKNDKSNNWSYTVPAEVLQRPYLDGQIRLILRTAEKDSKNIYWYCIVLPVGTGGYDGVKIEGSDKYWNGGNIGWIKETSIRSIRKK